MRTIVRRNPIEFEEIVQMPDGAILRMEDLCSLIVRPDPERAKMMWVDPVTMLEIEEQRQRPGTIPPASAGFVSSVVTL